MDKQYQPTLTEVQDWVLKLYNTCEQTITEAERREQHKYAVMVQRPQDKKFLVKMLDESSQIRDRRILAKRIKTLLDQYGVPEFLNKRDSFLFKMYQAFGHHFDFIAIPIIKKRVRNSRSIWPSVQRRKSGRTSTCWAKWCSATEKPTIVTTII